MKPNPKQIESVMALLKGKQISVMQLLAVGSEKGYDRSTTSTTKFSMKVTDVVLSAGGAHLQIVSGWDTAYAVLLANVTRLTINGNRLEIEEDFETETRRLTQIKIT